MERLPDKKSRLPFLIISIITNLGLLFFFKYYNFVADNINYYFLTNTESQSLPIFDFLLPVGISFYTFQTLSYSIDVFNGKQKAEHHLGYFALYVSFFPQLVAGPIERFSRLTPQLKAKHKLIYENLSKGFRLILYGLFIKMVIADNIAPIVDQIYSAPKEFSALDILKGVFLYSFQIYSDFYGYSLIAIGSAKLLGINLMDNFKTPYLSKNIAEFWQRWHISLSTWFRDYLYFPLGGNKVKKTKWITNILIVFIVSGIWHGANWTFLIWGALYGFVYLIEHLSNSLLNINTNTQSFSLKHILLAIKTFILVTFIWIFFISQNFDEALTIFKSIIENNPNPTLSLNIDNYVWILISLFVLSDLFLYDNRFDKWIDKYPFIARWSIYSILLFSIIVFAGVENFPFIYFQF